MRRVDRLDREAGGWIGLSSVMAPACRAHVAGLPRPRYRGVYFACDPHAHGPPRGTSALFCAHACRPAASYLAAPTYRRWRGCPSCRGAFSLQELNYPPTGFTGPDRFDGEEMMTAADSAELAQRYDPRDVQEKWQARWADLDPFRATED